MSTENLSLLKNRDMWHETPIEATLFIDDLSYPIGIKYRGSHVRKFKKKSFTIIFEEAELGVKEVHLNAEFMDKSLIRNKLSLDFFSDLDVLSPDSYHVNLYINDIYQGIYLQLESVDKYFLKRRNLPYGPIYYAENDNANFSLISPIKKDTKTSFMSGYSRKEGDRSDDALLKKFIYQINTLPTSTFEKEISNLIDVDTYLSWLAGVVCTQNYDGFIHNYALYRQPKTGLFEIIPWDYDATWGRDINGKIMDYDCIPIVGYNTLTARLLDISSFRKQYKTILQNILNDTFTKDYLFPKIKTLHKLLAEYVNDDPYLKNYLDQFDQEPSVIFDYIKDRRNYLINHLSDLD
nr:CotH kinase family protein [Terrilactibacillus tamarindi]